jgi:hypothetical protein
LKCVCQLVNILNTINQSVFLLSCKRRNSLYVSSTPVKFIRSCTFSRELMSCYVLHTCQLLAGRCSDCSMYLDPFSSGEGNLDRTIGVLHFKPLSPNMVMPRTRSIYICMSTHHCGTCNHRAAVPPNGCVSSKLKEQLAEYFKLLIASVVTKTKVRQICTFLLIILF